MSLSNVSLLAAFAGGVASFSSPCVLPLVPAYLSIVAGLDATRTAGATGATGSAAATSTTTKRHLGRVTRDTALFVLGFGTVFVLLGLSASALGRSVVHQQTLLTRVSGLVIVLMSLFMFATLLSNSPGLYREWRAHPRLGRLGPFAVPVAGAAFAFGWTPCVGPILASVLALSTQQDRVGSAAVLLSVYSLGLGAPFLAVALFFDRLRSPLAWLRHHGRAVTVLSASVLMVLGYLLILDRLSLVTSIAQRWI
ncbi:MAG TPA: cytochrome c biogenesis protein CcdA [Acidimicrobiales bacterium]|nr:cytochrome c biogenesis protein CcdA [Acidimicrobiales bacterium]